MVHLCGHLNSILLLLNEGDPDINAYKFNEEKLMVWLEKKIERLTKVLQAKNVNVMGGSVSATFVQSSTAQAPKGNSLF